MREDERYAVALVATSRRALGRFDALGQARPFERGEAEAAEELLLRAGLRLPRRVEWLGELGYARYAFHAPRVIDRRTGVGDALWRARVSLRSESMPHERWPWPAVWLAGLLRAPLGALAQRQGGSFGSGGAQLGLGAWEIGAGLEAKRGVLPQLELMLAAEAAYRFEDHALGRASARRLGPRVDATLGMRALPSDWFTASLALRMRQAGDVTLDHQSLAGTGERLWSVVVGAAIYDRASRFRSSVTVSIDPAFDRLSFGSTRAAALSVALGYGFE